MRLKDKDYDLRKEIFTDALFNSYYFTIDQLDCSKTIFRETLHDSFSNILDILYNDKTAIWNIKIDNYFDEPSFYKFMVSDMNSVSKYIWIYVNEENGNKILEKYNIKYI